MVLTRTVATGCERLRMVAKGCGGLDNIKRTHLHSQTPRVKRELLLHIREKLGQCQKRRFTLKASTTFLAEVNNNYPGKRPQTVWGTSGCDDDYDNDDYDDEADGEVHEHTHESTEDNRYESTHMRADI